MKKILVTDDDPSIQKAFKLALENLPLEIHQAENGRIGAEKALTNNYDMIFLDLKMPSVTGIEALRYLRSKGCKTPIHIITGFAEEYLKELEEAAKENYSFQLIRKPISNQKLRDLVCNTLSLEQENNQASDLSHMFLMKLSLYVFGDNEESNRTEDHLRNVLAKNGVQYDLEVIDLAKCHPNTAKDIIATPTLIKTLPPPVKQIIGEFGSDEHLLRVLLN